MIGKSKKEEPSRENYSLLFFMSSLEERKRNFLERAKNIHNNFYDYSLVEYKNAKTKVKIICPIHGVFEQTPDKHLNGQGCKECKKIKIGNNLRSKDFVERATSLYNCKYDYSLVNYKNNMTKVKIICPVHGVFEQIPGNHLDGHGCLLCWKERMNKDKRKTFEQFVEEANKIHNNFFTYTEYINDATKVKIICPKHGEFFQTPNKHLSGQGCPKCKVYKGEKIIMSFLEEKGVHFTRNKSFDDLKDVNLLSYDFYIEEKNLLIEYNGEQHYFYNNYFHKSLHKFHRQLHHDWLKRKYALKNNFNYLVISYLEDVAFAIDKSLII